MCKSIEWTAVCKFGVSNLGLYRLHRPQQTMEGIVARALMGNGAA